MVKLKNAGLGEKALLSNSRSIPSTCGNFNLAKSHIRTTGIDQDACSTPSIVTSADRWMAYQFDSAFRRSTGVRVNSFYATRS
jgi:hypothetical protein